MEKDIDWEIIYNLRIVSLNTTWKLNLSQINRLPLIKNIFSHQNFRDDSYLEESNISVDNFKYFSESILKKKEYFLIIENIFDEDPMLSPDCYKLLENIDWIFEKVESEWNFAEKTVYQILNPSYELYNLEKLYQCINCKIKVNSSLLFLDQECHFHCDLAKLERNYGEVLYCSSCGTEVSSINAKPPCKTLPKHCFIRYIKNDD